MKKENNNLRIVKMLCTLVKYNMKGSKLKAVNLYTSAMVCCICMCLYFISRDAFFQVTEENI